VPPCPVTTALRQDVVVDAAGLFTNTTRFGPASVKRCPGADARVAVAADRQRACRPAPAKTPPAEVFCTHDRETSGAGFNRPRTAAAFGGPRCRRTANRPFTLMS